jgi:hypothetical protein
LLTITYEIIYNIKYDASMKRLFLILAFDLLICVGAFSQPTKITITGKVTDFNNRPIDSAFVDIKNTSFNTVYSTYSNKNGDYTLTIDEGSYFALSCIRMRDYGINNLEFWAWNVQAFENLTINICYDKLEIYGVNVFSIQGGNPGYTMYFRPMSLTRFKNKMPDISPSIENMDLSVEINGKAVKVNSVQKVEEYTNAQKVYGFLIQTDLGDSTNKDFDIIKIEGKNKENNDMGEAIYYKVREKYK